MIFFQKPEEILDSLAFFIRGIWSQLFDKRIELVRINGQLFLLNLIFFEINHTTLSPDLDGFNITGDLGHLLDGVEADKFLRYQSGEMLFHPFKKIHNVGIIKIGHGQLLEIFPGCIKTF